MREPRYKFPDEVRSATRSLAASLVQTGDVPQTSEELQHRIAQMPEVEHALERGGYGPRFTASDLFPLFEVFVTKAGGHVGRTVEQTRRPKRTIHPALLGAALAVLVALLVIGLLT